MAEKIGALLLIVVCVILFGVFGSKFGDSAPKQLDAVDAGMTENIESGFNMVGGSTTP